MYAYQVRISLVGQSSIRPVRLPRRCLYSCLLLLLDRYQTERGIPMATCEIGAQQLVLRLPVAFGKSLHSHLRTLAAQDR